MARDIFNKIWKLLLSALAFYGFISTSEKSKAIESQSLEISNIEIKESKKPILILRQATEEDEGGVKIAYHYSHRSHVSHRSHTSHRSHSSHYSSSDWTPLKPLTPSQSPSISPPSIDTPNIPSESDSPIIKDSKIQYVRVDTANLKLEPKINSQIIMVLSRDQKVYVFEKQDGWKKVLVFLDENTFVIGWMEDSLIGDK